MKTSLTRLLLLLLTFYFSINTDAQLTGTYTINSAVPTGGTNFQNFKDLADTLNGTGVSGPVTVSVVSGSGPYVESVEFREVPGVSKSNFIIIKGNNETITNTITSTISPHIIRFNGTDYITLDSLTITSSSSSVGTWLLHLMNSSENNVISNCTFLGYDSFPSDSFRNVGIVINNDSLIDSIWDGGSNIKNTITHCSLQFLDGAIFARGKKDSARKGADDLLIVKNNIKDCFFGFRISDQNKFVTIDSNIIENSCIGLKANTNCRFLTISNNIFDLRLSDKYTSTITFVKSTGIDINNGCGDAKVLKNIIIATYVGITCGYESSRNLIANNCITLVNDSSYSGSGTGLIANQVKGDYNLFYNNSIYTDSSWSLQAVYFDNRTALGTEIVNNSFVGGSLVNGVGSMTGMYSPNVARCDFNNYYRNTSGYPVVYYQGKYVNDTSELRAAPGVSGHDLHSTIGNPYFTSNINLKPKGRILNEAGTNSIGVKEDVTGTPRPAIPGDSSDCGCYEFDPLEVIINGYLWLDLDSNCVINAGDSLFSNYFVQTKNETGFKANTKTDSNGFFELIIPDTGVFRTFVYSSDIINNCTDTLVDTLVIYNDTASGDLVIQPDNFCPTLYTSNFFSRDWGGSRIYNRRVYVNWDNLGANSMDSATLFVEFDSSVNVDSATLPYSLISPSLVKFDLGYVEGLRHGYRPSDKTIIYITIDSAKNVGSTLCVKSKLEPNIYCDTVSSKYDGSEIVLKVRPSGDSAIYFTILNQGFDMDATRIATLYEDTLIKNFYSFNLTAGDSQLIYVPLSVKATDTGITYTLTAPQHPFFPGLSKPIIHSELPGYKKTGSWSRAVIPFFYQDDEETFIDITCEEFDGFPYDPNIKEVTPVGFTASHFVNAGDQITYTVQFQNTGSAPATFVRLVDTLSIHLNIESLISGVSSHPYRVIRKEDRVIEWWFEDIYLPDSGSDFEGSIGFVKFTIDQKPGLSVGTTIDNQIAIIFDTNAPIMTNIPFVTIGEGWFDTLDVDSDLPIYHSDRMDIRLSPNPADDQVYIEISSTEPISDLQLSVFDIRGRLRIKSSISDNTIINLGELSAGIYIFEFLNGDNQVSIQKLIVE